MMSRPSAFTQRVYGVSFSVLNLLASSSETTAFLAIWLSLGIRPECYQEFGGLADQKQPYLGLAAARNRRLMIVMRMVIAMVVIMMMVMAVVVVMIVVVTMLMVMMVQALPRPRAARVLAEYQRLDSDRHG